MSAVHVEGYTTLSLTIAPTTDLQAARCQLEVAASRALRARGLAPLDWHTEEPDDGLCRRAMAGESVVVLARRWR